MGIGTWGEQREGVVFAYSKKDGDQLAQVYIPSIYEFGKESDDKTAWLPWIKVDIGEGASGAQGAAPTLYRGQRVLCSRVDTLTWVVTKKLSQHEPKKKREKGGKKGSGGSVGSGSSGGSIPKNTKVEPTKEDQKNVSDEINNEFMDLIDVPKLATASLNLLKDTIFGKVSRAITKFETFHAGIEAGGVSMERLWDVGKGMAIELLDQVDPGCGTGEGTCINLRKEKLLPPLGYVQPVITCGVGGIIDFTKDHMRTADCNGGSCGNIGDALKIDGWGIDLKNWNLSVQHSSFKVEGEDGELVNFSFDDNGDIKIPPGVTEGIHQIEFYVYNASKTLEEWMDPINQFAGGLGSQFTKGTMKINVVKDIMSLDFSESIDFLKNMKMPKIGPDSISALIPKIKFEMDPKGTDKATSGQIHIHTGPVQKSVSLEMDFTIGDNADDKKKKANKGQQKGK